MVDQAIAPDRKSKPKRALIVILATLVAGLGALLLAFVLESRERLRGDPSQSRKLDLLAGLLRRR